MQPVTAQWLADQVGADVDDVRDLALDRWERFLVWSGAGKQQTWSLVHRSFADFLATKVDLAEAHRLIVDHTFAAHADRFSEWDTYALKYAASHLVRAAAPSTQMDRHTLNQQLVDLVTSDAFRAEHARRLDEPAALQRDLELALFACADDPNSGSAGMATRTALALVDFRQEQLRSDAVFELARQGKIDEADQRLALVAAAADLDPNWHVALRLVIAWLAPRSAFAAARTLRSSVDTDTVNWPGVLHYLNYRVGAQLDTPPIPMAPPAELGPPASPQKAQAIVARLRGEGFDRSLIGGPTAASSILGEMLGANGGYQSAEDGPPLVACVVGVLLVRMLRGPEFPFRPRRG